MLNPKNPREWLLKARSPAENIGGVMRGRGWFVMISVVALVFFAGFIGFARAYFSDSGTSGNKTAATINGWYDLAWHWRKPISINNPGESLADFQVRLTVNTRELVSASKMQSEGGDIRFTASDGTTPIPHWLESGMDTGSTIFWVRVPSIPPGSSTIYLYYDNAKAKPASSGDDTFIFFDSFESDLSKWTETNPGYGSLTRVSSPVNNGRYSMRLVDTSFSQNFGVYASFAAQTNSVIEYDARVSQTDGAWEMQALSANTIGPRIRFSSGGSVQYHETTWSNLEPGFSYSANQWHSFRLGWADTGADKYHLYVTGSLKSGSAAFNKGVTSLNRVRFISESGTPTIYVDLVKVRRYAAAEPVVSGIGDEE